MAKREKSSEKRESLLQATLTLVNNNGFHDAPMSKIAKLAGVSVGTMYVYFENKQDLVNKLYLELKANYSSFAFADFSEEMDVESGFYLIWKNIATYKMTFREQANFLMQCDNSPMVDEASRMEGLKHIQPLLKLWEQGKEEGIIKKISPYILYAYSIQPISFLIMANERDSFEMNEKTLEEIYKTVWDAIRISQ